MDPQVNLISSFLPSNPETESQRKSFHLCPTSCILFQTHYILQVSLLLLICMSLVILPIENTVNRLWKHRPLFMRLILLCPGLLLNEYHSSNGVSHCHSCHLREITGHSENGADIDPALLCGSCASCDSHVHGRRLMKQELCQGRKGANQRASFQTLLEIQASHFGVYSLHQYKNQLLCLTQSSYPL